MRTVSSIALSEGGNLNLEQGAYQLLPKGILPPIKTMKKQLDARSSKQNSRLTRNLTRNDMRKKDSKKQITATKRP